MLLFPRAQRGAEWPFRESDNYSIDTSKRRECAQLGVALLPGRRIEQAKHNLWFGRDAILDPSHDSKMDF